MGTRLSLGALLAIWAPGLLGSPAGGRVGLDVLPSLVEVTQKAGDRFEREVTLSNGGDASLTVSVEVGDWSMSESGDVRFADAATLPGSCAQWIQVEPARVVIPPRGRSTVNLSVRSPADAVGTHWGVVFFTLPETRSSDQGSPITYLPRVGLTVYVTAEGTEREDFRLADVTAAESSEAKGIRLAALLENEGNVAVRFHVTWQVKSADGKFVRSYEARSLVALPGTRREAILQVPDGIPAGSFTVTGMVRWGSKRWAAKNTQLTVRPAGSVAA